MGLPKRTVGPGDHMAGAIAARFEGPSVAADRLGALNPLLAPG